MPLNVYLMLISGPLFIISLAAHIFVKLKMRPKDPDFDDYYYEVEDSHPEMQRFEKWSKITFTTAVIAALILFISISI